MSEVTTDVGCTVVVVSDVEDFKVDGGTEVTHEVKSIVDNSAIELAFIVDLLVATTDVGSRVIVTAVRGRLQSGRKFLRSCFLSRVCQQRRPHYW